MTRASTFVPLLWLLAGACTPYDPPEGVYPCTAGHTADCPAGWVCRTDHLCWRHELDASIGDASTDAGTEHDAPTCSAETCNDRDDDCDGRVDEGLAVVGAPVGTGSPTAMTTGVLISTSDGFGILCTAPSKLTSWIPLDRTGAPLTSSSSVGIGLDELSALASQADVLVLGLGNVNVSPKPEGFAFDATTGTRVWPTIDPYGFVTTDSQVVRAQVVDYTVDHATSYVLSGSVGARTLRRSRVDTITSSTAFGSTFAVDEVSQFRGLTVGSHELVVAFANEGVRLYRTVRGDAATSAAGETLVGLPGDGMDVAIASSSSTDEVGDSNPLGIAIARPAGSGVVFTEATAVSPVALGATITLAGSTGGGEVAVIAADSSGRSHHFFVAELRDTLRVWDVDGEPPVARVLDVHGDWTVARSVLSLATNRGSVRLAELDDMGNVVTRSLGCR